MFLADAGWLIASSWTQHADARNAEGEAVKPWCAEAVSWSLLGALVATYEQLAFRDGQGAAVATLTKACALLAHVLDGDLLSDWNDAAERTRADVLAALGEAACLPAEIANR